MKRTLLFNFLGALHQISRTGKNGFSVGDQILNTPHMASLHVVCLNLLLKKLQNFEI